MKWFRASEISVWLLGVVIAVLIGSRSVSGDLRFGPATLLEGLNEATVDDYSVSLSPDGLELYYGRGYDIYVATRATTEDEWGTPAPLGPPVNGPGAEVFPRLSPDGLELYFSISGGYGKLDLQVSRRERLGGAWGRAENLGPPINTSDHEYGACLSANGLELYFNSTGHPGGFGGHDLYVARRQTESSDWGVPENLGPVVNDESNSVCPFISPDGLTLFFSGRVAPFRSGGMGLADFWMTSRATPDDPWRPPVNLGPGINTVYGEACPWISHDGSMLYFAADWPDGLAPGQIDVWQARIIPIVDFNGDGLVDLVDLVTLIDNWGTNDTLYDVGPMPWGDGTVDVEDLKVFIAEWEKENPANSEGSE